MESLVLREVAKGKKIMGAAFWDVVELWLIMRKDYPTYEVCWL